MSHHYSGPDYGFPHGDARLDLTDLYVFPKPGDAGKSILIMDVHPSVGVNPPGPTTDEPFATNAVYELKIDTNGDLVPDIAYRVSFSPYEGGAQAATLRRVEGAQAAGTGDSGQTIIEAAPVSTGREARVTVPSVPPLMQTCSVVGPNFSKGAEFPLPEKGRGLPLLRWLAQRPLFL
jgi:hypothetical protein